jgi:steroid delta-isomerase-like uncharacterized protein
MESSMADNAKAVFNRYAEELWNRRNEAAINELIAPDFVGRIAGAPDIVGIEAYKQFFTAAFAAFPDARSTVDQMLADGDRVAAHWSFQGTHQGEYAGIAPTGKNITSTTTAIYHIASGKIAEIWGDSDNLGLLRQLTNAVKTK